MSDMMVVNFGALQQASADISRAVEMMRSQLDELERQAAPLVASWDGGAKAAYAQRQAAWRRAAGDLAATLHHIKIAVDESVADYLHTEQRNTELFL